MAAERTRVALNTHGTPTAAFVRDTNWQFPAGHCDDVIDRAAMPGQVRRLDANQLATQLLGDTIYANPLMLGYAWQMGWVPLSRAALLRAIELNAVQVDNNKAAFEWGCRAAHDLGAVQTLAAPVQTVQFVRKTATNLDELIKTRVAFLTDYQSAAYAQDYQTFVTKVRLAEQALGSTKLTDAVARQLFRLMAYKDEYEVARLLTDRRFHDKVAQEFEGDYTLSYHLAPPFMGKTNASGEPVKQRFGSWMGLAFKVLAPLKALRGTPIDPFGRTHERQRERAWIVQYRQGIERLLESLSIGKLKDALAIARIPEDIKGYGHIKAASMDQAQARWDQVNWTGAEGPPAT
jgi:indolepyruvate ferredoxin oxidoreductase